MQEERENKNYFPICLYYLLHSNNHLLHLCRLSYKRHVEMGKDVNIEYGNIEKKNENIDF